MQKLRLTITLVYLFFLFSKSAFGQPCNVNINTGGPTSFCLGGSIVLTASGANTYTWAPATGLSATTVAAVTATPTTTTTYTVTGTCNSGNTGTSTITIAVLPLPNVPIFNIVNNSTCAGSSVLMSTTNQPGVTFSWNYGDGTALGAGTNVSHIYNPPAGNGTSNYTVTVTATNTGTGCSRTATQIVNVKQKPDAAIADYTSSVPFTNCGGTSFNLVIDNVSTTIATNTLYQINWGDGSPNYSNANLPLTGTTHTYTTQGYFTLTLTVTGQNGCISTKTYSVFNGTNPAVPFINPGASILECLPFVFSIPSNATTNPPGTIYIITKNDGTPDDTLNHPPPPFYTHIFTTSSCGATGGTVPNSFFVKIKAENPCGFTYTTIEPITTVQKPIANFSISPDTIDCINTVVTFTNTSQSAVAVNNFGVCDTTTKRSWIITPATGWTIASGTLGTLPATLNPATWGSNTLGIVFNTIGQYSITFIADGKDTICGGDTITKIVCIIPPPIASFIATPLVGCAPLNVNTTTLINTTNCDTATYLWTVTYNGSAGCLPTTGNWNFTNGTNQNSLQPQFSFIDPGVYLIKLTVTNKCGSDDTTEVITVKAKPQINITPVLDFCLNGVVIPTATVINCLDTITPLYNWSFTGGVPATSNLLNPPPVTYNTAGTYSIIFSVTNSCGVTKDTVTFQVFPKPIPIATANPYTICFGDSAILTASNSNGVPTYTWSPALGLSATIGSPIKASPFTTTIYTLTATFPASGCFATDTVIVNVLPLPVVTVLGAPNPVCLNDTTFLTASGANTYTWSPATGLNATTGSSVYAIITNPAGQTYTVTGTNAAGCKNTAAVTITTLPLPNVIGVDTIICVNSGLIQLVSNPGPSNWTGNFVSTTGLFNTNASGIGVFSVNCIYLGGNGCEAKDSVKVTVVAPQIANAGTGFSICVNAAAVTLTGYSPLLGTWSGAGVTGNVFDPAAAGVGAHVLTYSFGSGTCLSTDTIQVTVNPLPTVTVNSATICVGNTTTLTAGGATVYSWSPSTGLSTTTGVSVTANPILSTTYTVTGTSAFGCTNTATSAVTVNPLPIVNAGPSLMLCNQPIPYTLLGYSPAGGTWTGPGVTAGGVFTPSGVGSDTLTYSFTDLGTGCSNSDTLIIIVVAAQIANAGTGFSICVNAAAVTLTGYTPTGGTWSGAGLTGNVFDPSAAGVGTFVLTYSFGSGTCLTTDTIQVTVNTLPTVTVNSATICVGNNTTLTASGATNYSWSPSTGLSASTGASVTANPILSTTYTVTGTNGFGCTSTATSVVTVNPLPIVNAGPSITLCNQLIPDTLSGYSPTGGTWSGPGVTTGGVFTPSATGTFTLTYTYTDGVTGCTNFDTLIVTVVAPQIANAGTGFSICVNAAAVTLTGYTPLGGTWSGTGLTGNVFDPSAAGVGAFVLTYSFGSGTCLTTDTIQVTVNPLPTVTVNSATICVGNNTTLTASGATTYSWSPATGLSATTGASVTANPIVSATYTVTGTNAFGCTNMATSVVTVNPLPIVDAGPDSTVCNQPIPVTLTGTPTGGTWTGSGVTGNTFDPSIAGVGSWALVYSYQDANGCSNTDTVIYTVINPTLSNAGVDDSLCVGSAAVQLTGTPIGGSWSGTGVTVTGLFTPSGAGVFTLTYSVGSGSCLSTDNVNITVMALPVITTTPPTATICINDSVQLTASSSNNPWQAISYTWTPPVGLTTTNTAQVWAHPIISTTYTVTGTSSFGCTNTATSLVTVNPLPIVDAGPDSTVCNQPIPVTLTGTPTGGNWSGTGVTANSFNPSVAGVGTWPLVYTYQDGNNCINTDTVNYTVINPSLANAGVDDSLCVGSAAVQLTGLPAGGTWSGAGVTTIGLFTPSVVGLFNLVYSYGSGTCLNTDTASITVMESPLMIINTPNTICINDSVQIICLSNNNPYQAVQFNWTPVTGLTTTNTASVWAHPTNTTTYTVIGTNTFGCIDSAISVLNVNQLPIVDAGPDSTVCDQPIQVTLTGTPSGGNWSGTGVTANSFNPSVAGVGTWPLVYTYQDGNNCINTDTVNYIVINPSLANAGTDDSLCVGSAAVQLTGLPAGGTWSGAGVTPGGLFNPSVVGVFTLTYSYGAGTCLNTDSVIITVMELPSMIVNTPNTICINDSVQIVCMSTNNPYQAIQYSWLPTVGLTTSNTASVWAHPLATTTYIVTGTNAFGCVDSAFSLINVNPLPIVNAGPVDTTFCNQPIPVVISVTATPSGGIWSGPGVAPNGTFTPSQTGTFYAYYTYTNPFTTCTNLDSILVNVINPVQAIAGSNDSICINNPTYVLPGFSPAGGLWIGNGIINPLMGIFDPGTAGVGTHMLIYKYGAGSCETSDTIYITIYPLPVLILNSDIDTCISVGILNLIEQPAGGLWSGTGIINQTQGLFDPTVAGAGVNYAVYNYTSPITNCSNTDSVKITIRPLPNATFVVDSVVCKNSVVQFLSTNQVGATYLWNFGDNTTATIYNPTHVYTNIGLYTVSLIVTSVYGCIDSSSYAILVVEPPVAFFTPDVHDGCGPLTVNFTNGSSGYGITYVWDLGNGQTSTNVTPPTIIYTASAYFDTTYYVTLTVTNLCGVRVHTDSIIVHPSPTAVFGTNVSSGCSPLPIYFSNNSYGLATSYYWSFGDGTFSTDSLPTFHVYYTGQNDTTYQIMMIATNACNTDTVYQLITVYPNTVTSFFNTNPTSGCEPLTVTFTNYSTGATNYSWVFGDGNFSNLTNVVHTYDTSGIFTAYLVADNGCAKDSASITIEVYSKPIVTINAIKDTACKFEQIQFINTTTNLSSITWYFGDGDSSSVSNPIHSYALAGTYIVSAIGYVPPHDCYDTARITIQVFEPPTASLTPLVTDGCAPLVVQFNNTSTNGTYFQWIFDDGNYSVLQNPTNIFLDSGLYNVQMILTDVYGCADTAFSSINVYPKPESSFTLAPLSNCFSPVDVNFTNTSTSLSGSLWDFGNGQTATANNPTTTYTTPSNYSISLITTNTYGCKDTSLGTFNLYPTPIADGNPLINFGCADLEVQFANNSINGVDYIWYFGDGTFSTDEIPTHVYTDSGMYQITLIANGVGGCADTIQLSQQVTVDHSPTSDFSFVADTTQAGYGLVYFTNQSIDAISYAWLFGDGNQSNLVDPEHRYVTWGDYEVTLIAYGANGCTDTIRKKIFVDYFKGLFVPNVLAPLTGVGEEKIFLPKGKGLKTYHLQIFNTWGEMMWESNLLENGSPKESWDGYFKGELCPLDVYVWKITAYFEDGSIWTGQDRHGKLYTTGTITLLR